MMEPVKPFDPLDPQQRVRRGRERAAFFRQIHIFPIVVLTMLVFVPLAIWYQPLAIPFLGWMAVMPPMVSGLDRAWANWKGGKAKFGRSNLIVALVCIVLFVAIGFPLTAFALLIVAGVTALLYAIALLKGLILPVGDDE